MRWGVRVRWRVCMNMMVGGGCRSGSGGGGSGSGCVNKSVVVTQVAFTTVSV